MFDGIAYGKAGAVLGMVENYLGEETFRQGVHNYLQAHLYANATAEDFWNAQTANSHLPVDKIMESFVTQPGVPLLTFSDASAGSAPVAQSRFFLSTPANASTAQQWTLPVCIKTTAKPICRVLTPKDSSPSHPRRRADAVFLRQRQQQRLLSHRLHPDAVQRHRSQSRNRPHPARAHRSPGRPLGPRPLAARVMSATTSTSSWPSSKTPTPQSSRTPSARSAPSTRRIATDEDRTQLATVLYREFSPIYTALGQPSKSDSFDRQQLRALLFETLGAAKDPAILTEARQIADRAYAAPATRTRPSTRS